MAKFKNLVRLKNHDFFHNFKNINIKPGFFTLKTRLAFIKLKQIFVKAPIFFYFDPEYYIRIKTDASGYAINGILSQLILGNLD